MSSSQVEALSSFKTPHIRSEHTSLFGIRQYIGAVHAATYTVTWLTKSDLEQHFYFSIFFSCCTLYHRNKCQPSILTIFDRNGLKNR